MKIFVVFCVLKLFDLGNALNENCTKDDDCSRQEKTVCLASTCACKPSAEYNEKLKKCLNYATEYGSICFDETQCSPFLGVYSTCQNNICMCTNGYRWYQGKCQKYAAKNERCENGTNSVICLDPSNPLSLKCGSNNTCECSEGYYDRGSECRLKSELRKECAISEDCFPVREVFGMTYSHCELGKCVKNAQINYHSERNYTIMNAASNFEVERPIFGKAEDGILSRLTKAECNSSLNAIYFKDTCVCKQGFFLYNEKCIAELGMEDKSANYTSDADCPIKPGKLLEGTCYCRDYWFQSDTNRECKKTTLQYTQNCMDNDWCQAMGAYAFCNKETGKCQCSSQAVLNETSFHCDLKKDANFTDVCMSDSQCPLYEACVDEKCKCTEGFYRVNGTGSCLPKIGQSCEFRDCSHIGGASCNVTEEVCQCAEGYVTDGFLCLEPATKLGEKCDIEEQCVNIKHSSCLQEAIESKNGTTRCLCTDEYSGLKGSCYALKHPGSLCSTQTDCTIILGDTFVCRNMLCQCPIGKSLNENNICVTSSVEKHIFTPTTIVLCVFSVLVYNFNS